MKGRISGWTVVCPLALIAGCGGSGGGGGFSGIPAQVVPNLRAEVASDLEITHENIGGGSMQKILRLSSRTSNYGDGPMEIFGEIEGADTSMLVAAFQIIHWNNGDRTSVPAGEFMYHPVHSHWHWEALMAFRLMTTTNPNDPFDASNIPIANTDKVSFCLLDTSKIPGFNHPNQPGSRRYRQCNRNTQGISCGWFDIYTSNLYGQWIVLDGVPDGVYWLVTEADPAGMLAETSETDNRAAIKIQIAGDTVTIL